MSSSVPRGVVLPLPEGGTGEFHVEWMTSFRARARGLLGRDGLPGRRVAALQPCGSIHTLGMRFSLDVIFFDADGRVVRAVRGVRPGRWIVWGGLRVAGVLELEAGRAEVEALRRGDRLHWIAGDSGIPV